MTLSWIAVGVFGAGAGLLTAMGSLSLLVTALFVGHWADTWEQRQAMIVADLVRAGVLALVVAAWVTSGSPSPVALALAVTVLGACQAVFRPAMQALVPALVEPSALPAANALFDTTDRIARLLGPGLVGMLAGVVPARHFLSVNAASFLVSAAALAAISRLRRLPALRRGQGPATGLLHGFRVMRQHPVLGVMLGTTGVINGCWVAILFLGLPLLLEQYGISGPGGTGLGAYGLVISAYGCTNLLATLVVGNTPIPAYPGRRIFGGNLVVGIGLLLLGLVPISGLQHAALLPALCLAAALAAPGGPLQDIATAVLRQTELPRDDIPAAMRAYLVVSNLGALCAMTLAPILYSVLPVSAGISLLGATIMSVAVYGLQRCWSVRCLAA